MLVLTRKESQAVTFGGPGRVVVLEILANKVRLGFEADPSVAIHREEVCDAIHREARESNNERS